MSTRSIYLAGSTSAEVDEATAAWFSTNGGTWVVESAEDYPGFTIAVDFVARDEKRARSLLDYLRTKFPTTPVELDATLDDREMAAN